MNQLTEEQRTTLIRHALTIAKKVCHGHFCDAHPMGQAEVCKLTTEAISLLDSQAAGSAQRQGFLATAKQIIERHTHETRAVGHTDCDACLDADANAAASIVTALHDVATAMRDACVNAVKALRSTPRGAAYGNAISDAVHKIESLTLDQVQEKRK